MKRKNYKRGLHLGILYIVLIISIITNIILNNNITIGKKTEIIKTMNETTEVANLNNTINKLQESHLEYATKVQSHKTNLATAITNAGILTNGDDTFETMITNVSNIVSSKTSDATATAEQILSGQTAYVNGSKVTGTMQIRSVGTKNIGSGETYTIPKGYHDGTGKVVGKTTLLDISDSLTGATKGYSGYYYMRTSAVYIAVFLENVSGAQSNLHTVCTLANGTMDYSGLTTYVNTGTVSLLKLTKPQYTATQIYVGVSNPNSTASNYKLKVYIFC